MSSAEVHIYLDYLTFWIFAPEYLPHVFQGSYIRRTPHLKTKTTSILSEPDKKDDSLLSNLFSTSVVAEQQGTRFIRKSLTVKSC